MNLAAIRSAYLIGFGGAGVSGLARLLLSRGAAVAGTDAAPSLVTRALEQLGVRFTDELPEACDLLVYSTAVPIDHPLREAAARRGIAALSYPEMLGELSQQYATVAVAGTNGKSTTTAMLATIMEAVGLDPTVIVGAPLVAWGNSNFRVGQGKYLVVEACEYQENFLHLRPQLAVITNIAPDHLDYYGDFSHVQAAFAKFAAGVTLGGTLVYNADDPSASAVALSAKAITVPFGKPLQFSVPIPGEHNRYNAAAAATAAMQLGVTAEGCESALAGYRGIARRLEQVGECNGVLILSDYAHHPDAIRLTLAALRERYPSRRLLVLFQPHQGNRTRQLMAEFSRAFGSADEIIIAEVYRVTGREHGADAAVSSRTLVEKISQVRPQVPCRFAPDEASAESMLRATIKSNDVVVIMGAGTIDAVARRLVL